MDVVIELIESLGLLLCLMLATPLGMLKRMDRFFNCLSAAPLLLRERLFASYLRARLDQRMGNYQQAVVILQNLVLRLEELNNNPRIATASFRRLLLNLYCDMQELYFLSGQVGEAVGTVVRAQKHLGVDRLPSNPELDIKAAHVIKAGLAATRLLEDGGIATLMVRPGEEPLLSRPPFSTPPRRTDAAKKPTESSEAGAKIIPFPIG